MTRSGNLEMDEFFREFAGNPEYEREKALGAAQTHLAINLLRLRRARGATQAQLAARAGMRQPRIAEIERGDYNPRLDTIAKLAWALGTTVDSLVADPGRVPPAERAGAAAQRP